MADYFVKEESLIAVADAIREKTGETAELSFPADFILKINALNSGSNPEEEEENFPNGIKWTQSNLTGSGFGYHAFANGVFIELNNEKGIYYSEDGKTWNRSNITSGTFSKAPVYKNNFWYVDNNSVLYYSEDNGKTWSQSIAVDDIDSLPEYAYGVWVVATSNGPYYSTDGKTWSPSNITGDISLISYGNGVFVTSMSSGYFSQQLYYSKDGKTWTSGYLFNELSGAPGLYGEVWLMAGSSNVIYSTDGINWNQATGITSNFLTYFDYAHDTLFAANASGVFWSKDGKTWAQSNYTINTYPIIVSESNNVIVMSPYNAEDTNICRELYYSTDDGKTWIQSNMTNTTGANFVYENGIFLASVFNGDVRKLIYSIDDGKTWNETDLTECCSAPLYGRGVWVVASNNGVYYSIAWKPTT